MTTRRLLVAGRVQGVGYRQWLRAEAEALGLSGWVRNRRDGSVEALLSGSPAALDGLADRCRRGPSLASVSSVAMTDDDEAVAHAGVDIRATS